MLLVGSLFLIGSFILVAVRHTRNIARKGLHSSEDETVFRLLASAPDAPELATVVLIVSLLSVALLITGICFIIVIAIAMDSNTRAQTVNPCELKRAENGHVNRFSSSKRRDMNFDYESEEEEEYGHANGLYSTPLLEWPNTIADQHNFMWSTAAMLMPNKMRLINGHGAGNTEGIYPTINAQRRKSFST
uniref:Uncharacterized protein n=1 Tax=Ditylenchus dipsaci TaxID=166011 RepID=A0A915EQT8_9BILA